MLVIRSLQDSSHSCVMQPGCWISHPSAWPGTASSLCAANCGLIRQNRLSYDSTGLQGLQTRNAGCHGIPVNMHTGYVTGGPAAWLRLTGDAPLTALSVAVEAGHEHAHCQEPPQGRFFQAQDRRNKQTLLRRQTNKRTNIAAKKTDTPLAGGHCPAGAGEGHGPG